MATLRTQKILRGVALGLGIGLAVLLLHEVELFNTMEWKSWDWRLRTFSDPGQASPEIVIVLVDQHSLDFYEQDGLSWPWPRQLYAAAVQFFHTAGSRAMVFDVLFSENSVYGLEDDLAFGQAISLAGNVDLAVIMSAKETSIRDTTGREILWQHAIQIPGFPERRVVPRNSVTLSVDEILSPARSMGNVSFPPDGDGIFRRLPLVFSYEDRLFPALPLAVAHHLRDGPFRAHRQGDLEWAGQRIPLDEDGQLLIKYYGGVGTYTSLSMASVIQSQLQLEEGLEPQIDPDFFRDKIVLVGFSAPGLMDLRPTPFSSVYPGVEIHATVIDNLINGDFFSMAHGLATSVLILLMTLAMGLAVSVPRKIWHMALLALICVFLPFIAAIAAFRSGIWLPLAAPLAGVLICFAGGSVLNYSLEGRQKRFVKKVFRHYLSHQVIEEILKNPEKLRLGGQRREMSVFFSDVVGFTSVAESLTPEALTELLNFYLSEMTQIIFVNGGTVDKYIGDAIVAFWNAPLDQSDHAQRACLAALDCQRRLEELREQMLQVSGQQLFMRIGVNTGPMVVGNMGSRDRFDYSVLGDAVNLGARLEGACKQYGISILIGEQTYREAEELVEAREVDLIRVVGKREPVRIYQLLGRKGQLSENQSQELEQFRKGLELYRQKKWTEAVEVFRGLEHDPVAKVYLERCELYRSSPPPDDWDGVWELTKK
jgi:adenylate cyclase